MSRRSRLPGGYDLHLALTVSIDEKWSLKLIDSRPSVFLKKIQWYGSTVRGLKSGPKIVFDFDSHTIQTIPRGR